jgi:hypothetical protein
LETIDFYEYACGSWTSPSPGIEDFNWSNHLQNELTKTFQKLFQLAEAPRVTNPNFIQNRIADKELFQLAKHVYSQCIHQPTNVKGEKKDAVAIITKLFNAFYSPIPNEPKSIHLARSIATVHSMGLRGLFALLNELSATNRAQYQWYLFSETFEGETDYWHQKPKVMTDAEVEQSNSLQENLNFLKKLTLDASNDRLLEYLTGYLTKLNATVPFEMDPLAFQHLVKDVTLFKVKLMKLDGLLRSTSPQRKLTLADLAKQTPSFDWKTYHNTLYTNAQFSCSSATLKEQCLEQSIVARHAEFPLYFNEIISSTNITTIKFYVATIFVIRHWNYLSPIQEGGSTAPREEFCAKTFWETFPNLASRLYYHDHNAKSESTVLSDFSIAMKQSLMDLIRQQPTWPKEAKGILLDHVHKVDYQYKYAEETKDPNKMMQTHQLYMSLRQKGFIQSMVDIQKMRWRVSLQKSLSKSTLYDHFRGASFWPAASYDPWFHNVLLPQGLLQTPFYQSKVPMALNFGALGAVIGHENTHALNAVFNQNAPNVPAFDRKSLEPTFQCLRQQYGVFSAEHTSPVPPASKYLINGQLTLEENVSDNLAVHAAYNAFTKLSSEERVKRLSGMDSFSPEQLLFISYAQIHCETASPLTKLLNSFFNHAPRHARVHGPLQNSKAFAEAFECPLKSNMNPESKCLVL